MKHLLTLLLATSAFGQGAGVTTELDDQGKARIVLEARGFLPEVPFLFSATATSEITVSPRKVEQTLQLQTKRLQGKGTLLALGLAGEGTVTSVAGYGLKSWSVRQEGTDRFLDLSVDETITEGAFAVTIASDHLELPRAMDLAHLRAGKAAALSSVVMVKFDPRVEGRIAPDLTGFEPVETKGMLRFTSTGGGRLPFQVSWRGAAPREAYLESAALTGTLAADGKSATFKLDAIAVATEADVTLPLLARNAAVTAIPALDGMRWRLGATGAAAVHSLEFTKPGRFPFQATFITAIRQNGEWSALDFELPGAGAVVPVKIAGLAETLEFGKDGGIVPKRSGPNFEGFLPASGLCQMTWRASKESGDGRLFFTTNAIVECQVGVGLLRQNHRIDFKVLQGKLDRLDLDVAGPGEIVAVEGEGVVAWSLEKVDAGQRLAVRLDQPVEGELSVTIKTQTALEALPFTVAGMRLSPVGAVRHSGFLRIATEGAVRIEPVDLTGLTQLAPGQFPDAGAVESARQIFAYRFPSGVHAFGLKVDRVQPEIVVSQVTVYRFGETARVIDAEIELDIREAPVREFEVRVPADYSVGAVEGSELADHVPGTIVENGQRSLRLVFAKGIEGRHLVHIELELNGSAAATTWAIPKLEFPEAKNVTGDLGVAGEAGFRLTAGTVAGLAERPVAQFPKQVDRLQQAFRIRSRDWSATMAVESLPQSIQADVFHLHSLSERRAHVSVLMNYLVSGSPVSVLEVALPKAAENVAAEGRDVRGWQRDGDTLKVTLHQPVLGTYTLLITYQEKIGAEGAVIRPGEARPLKVASERGFIQVASPVQVLTEVTEISPGLLSIDPLELPAELRLLNSAPPLATYQYTARPYQLGVRVEWFNRAATAGQVVEFAEAEDRISPEGEVVTTFTAFVKSRGQGGFRFQLPEGSRLWSVTVDGQQVNARQNDAWMIVPLPTHANPNVPLEVQVKLGREGPKERTTVRLPVIDAPVLKTAWRIVAEGDGKLEALSVTAKLPQVVPPGNGARWIVEKAFWPVLGLVVLCLAAWASNDQKGWRGGMSQLLSLTAAILAGTQTIRAWSDGPDLPSALNLSLPSLSPGEVIQLQVRHVEPGEWVVSIPGILLLIAAAVLAWTELVPRKWKRERRVAAVATAAIAILLDTHGAAWLLGLLTVGILARSAPAWWSTVASWRKRRTNDESGDGALASVPLWIIGALLLAAPGFEPARAGEAPQPWLPEGWSAPQTISESWTIGDEDLVAEGKLVVSGALQERFVFLAGTAVLTKFESASLTVSRAEIPGAGPVYVATLSSEPCCSAFAEATFSYRLAIDDLASGFPIATGPAAIHDVKATYAKPGWSFDSTALMEAVPVTAAGKTVANLRLSSEPAATMTLKPQGRDPRSETTAFHVESRQLVIARPGVIDGRHEFELRPSRGLVKELTLMVPELVTIGDVEGAVANWRFDAEQRKLVIVLEEAQSETFTVTVATQRTLADLPAEVKLEPLRCTGAEGEVGLIAVAVGSEIQPENSSADGFVAVNPDDFPLPDIDATQQAVLHRVFRYGAAPGSITLRMVAVAPELRVTSDEVLSFGEERVVLGSKMAIEISRAGLFQLGFAIPAGYEVETLSGSCVRDWSEAGNAVRINLNGKTLGSCELSVTLSAAASTGTAPFSVPRLTLDGVNRQTGQLVIRPAAGIRLSAAQRRNISELDSRTTGGQNQGTLAFRILHQDWALDLTVEKLDPWITGQILQDVTLREGQTRTVMYGRFKVEQASIRSLRVKLPVAEGGVDTVRAIGEAVSDIVKEGDAWEIRFRRRIFGDVDVRIEFEKRQADSGDEEAIVAAAFPDVNQLTHHVVVRTSGRLEMEPLRLAEGWQAADWTNVPQSLRDQGNRNTPAESLRVLPNAAPLSIQVRRHELADALRLRVSSGTLRTVFSASGTQVTLVDLAMTVVQRGSLDLSLPNGAELFHIHVNGESANAVQTTNGLRFHVLPNAAGGEASVQVAYAVRATGGHSANFALAGPRLDVPMENIRWRVFVPDGLVLKDHKGGFRPAGESALSEFDRAAFLSATTARRSGEAKEAEALLVQANNYLQSGRQSLAGQIFYNAANRSGLDDASNEDARVQLDNLKTQQAIAGLNTRRQRLMVDNGLTEDSAVAADAQLVQKATSNAIINSGRLELAPQEMSELLQSGSGEDQAALRRIAGKIVEQQQGAAVAPRSIAVLLPEGGRVHEFVRPVQVGENATLDLELILAPEHITSVGRWLFGWTALVGMAAWTTGLGRRKA